MKAPVNGVAAGRRVVVASVPGRVCLAGESLDWMIGGSSITAAVPLRTRVAAWRARGSVAVCLTSGSPVYQSKLVPADAAASPNYTGHVLDYLQASARVGLQTTDRLAGVVLSVSTELAVGAGLSSSAALTAAACAATTGLDGHEITGPDVCRLARQAECDELGSGAGWMDFLACVNGGVNRIDASTTEVTRLADSLGVPLVVIDTRERRATKTVLASKRTRFAGREPAMVSYVNEAVKLVDALEAELRAPVVDYPSVGGLLTAGHELLRDLVQCSTPLLDTCVERVLTAGAYGAKLTGSGHGGCLVALAAEDALGAVLASLADLPVHSVALPASERRGLVTEGMST